MLDVSSRQRLGGAVSSVRYGEHHVHPLGRSWPTALLANLGAPGS